eukprot:GEZU01008877.1.p1 GENE.GEZU01008877.1~~GEZU01008877.1.p1  ORF type:complete len:487 (-),score=90.68 GEZU01008877.1:131-1591(-)
MKQQEIRESKLDNAIPTDRKVAAIKSKDQQQPSPNNEIMNRRRSKDATTETERPQQDVDSKIGANERYFPHPPEARESMLSDSYHNGFMNLTGALIMGWTIHHLISNYMETGSPLDLSLLKIMMTGFPFMLFLWICCIAFTLTASMLLQYLKQWTTRDTLARRSVVVVYASAQIILFFVPIIFAHQRPMSPMIRAALCMQICVLSMKMHSYYMTNNYLYWNNKSLKKPPQLTLKKRLYEYTEFLCIPTLVFEKQYPRTPKVRVWYVVKEWSVALMCMLVLYFLFQKYLLPTLRESVNKRIIDVNIFELCAPTVLAWMIGFYCVFHCILNGLAELTRFADREFYLDWWNATTMGAYWRLWNRAVYKWMARHIYLESMRQVKLKVYNKKTAAIGTFIVTAMLHEYVLSNAFRMFRPWLALLIMLQIPLIYLTELPVLKGSRYGNLIMWASMVVGMPAVEMWYARDYYILHSHELDNMVDSTNTTIITK